MSREKKLNERIEKWISIEGISFKNEKTKEKYMASLNRFLDAVLFRKEPDRVPVFITGTFLVPYIYKLTPYEAMYDYEKVIKVHLNFLEDFDPDYAISPGSINFGKILELIGFKQYKWPGHGVPPSSVYQYVENIYMEAEEYQWLINNPSDFWLRAYLPRTCKIFEPFKTLSPFTDLWEIILYPSFFVPFGSEVFQETLMQISRAGREALLWTQKMREFSQQAKAMGYPLLTGGVTKAPFDIIADTLRGTKEALLDMYRRPELLKRALEVLTPLAISQGVRGANLSNSPIVFIPLHKGCDEFMSDAQFRTFYWPSFKNLIEGLVEEGCIPYIFAEGSFEKRLEYFRELPEKSCFIRFEKTNMEIAKKTIGDKICIAGNVPASLIISGTPEEVRYYCKKLIDTCAPGGGFILSPGSSLDEANPENLKVIIQVCRENL